MNQQPVTGEQDSFVPFTKAERIQQLGEIDKVRAMAYLFLEYDC